MKTPKNVRSKIAIVFSVLAFSVSAQAFENQFQYVPKQLEIQASGNYFKTDGNYKSGGSKDSLPASFSYHLIDANIRSRFVLFENWAVFGSMNVGTSESKDNIKTLTNSTLNWASIGTDYRWLEGAFNLYTDLDVIIPFEKVATDMDTSLNWDGAIHFRPRVIGEFPLGTFTPYGYAGIDWRDKGLSTLALFGGGLRFNFSDLQIGAELNGYTSIKDDQYTNDVSQREGVINNFNGSSKKFYSINPSLFDSNIYMNYRISHNWQIGVDGGLTLSGSENASGFHGGGFVKFFFDAQTRTSSRMHSEFEKAATPAPPRKEFQEDTEDGVDQTYFAPAPPVRPTPPAPPAGSDEYKIKLKKTKPKKSR